MAILRMDSFDYSTNGSSAVGVTNWGNGLAFETGRTGPRSIRGNGGPFGAGDCLGYALGKQVTTAWMQVATYRNTSGLPQAVPSGDIDHHILGFWANNHGYCHIAFALDTDYRWGLYRGSGSGDGQGATLLTTGTEVGMMTQGNWYFLEAYLELSDSSGRAWLKQNGELVIDWTGDTQNTASFINYVSTGGQYNNNYGGAGNFFDDLIAGDDSGGVNVAPLGDARVEYVVPNAPGAFTQFTPTGGANWTNVDETGNADDGTYNSTQVQGSLDTFGMSDLSSTGVVWAVQSVLRHRKDDAGTRYIRPVFYKSNGVGNTPRLYEGSNVSVADTFAYSRQIFEVSPDTGTAWGTDEIADLEFGYTVGGTTFHMSLDAEIAGF